MAQAVGRGVQKVIYLIAPDLWISVYHSAQASEEKIHALVMFFCKFETKLIPQRNLPQRPVVIDWKDITSDFYSDLMHISAGKLDGADLRPRELWTMNEFKIF